jgi:hypothetical protein
MAKRYEQIPAAPFRDLLQQRMDRYERMFGFHGVSNDAGLGCSPSQRLADDCGWPGEAGVRKLYRYRYGLKEGSLNGKKGARPTHTFPRDMVEEALHELGVNFTQLYGDYAARLEGSRAPARDVLTFIRTFEPLAEDLVGPVEVREAWCVRCAEVTLRDRAGDCQWCAGAREFKLELEKRARAKREYDRDRVRALRQAA